MREEVGSGCELRTLQLQNAHLRPRDASYSFTQGNGAFHLDAFWYNFLGNIQEESEEGCRRTPLTKM